MCWGAVLARVQLKGACSNPAQPKQHTPAAVAVLATVAG